MPKGPRGSSRPADVIGICVKIMRTATEEKTDELPTVSPGAALGEMGGQTRARNMAKEQRDLRKRSCVFVLISLRREAFRASLWCARLTGFTDVSTSA